MGVRLGLFVMFWVLDLLVVCGFVYLRCAVINGLVVCGSCECLVGGLGGWLVGFVIVCCVVFCWVGLVDWMVCWFLGGV